MAKEGRILCSVGLKRVKGFKQGRRKCFAFEWFIWFKAATLGSSDGRHWLYEASVRLVYG